MIISILILGVLVVILIKLCVKPRNKFTRGDYRDAAISRAALGLLVALGGFAFPPVWLVSLILFASSIAFFKHAKNIPAE
jgi:hypothetical protein